MCRLFASQSPESYAFETRSIRLNGQSTSLRLEKVFWSILEQIADSEGMSVPRFISTLHNEVLLMWGEMTNFTSHLRCICLVAVEEGRARRDRDTSRPHDVCSMPITPGKRQAVDKLAAE